MTWSRVELEDYIAGGDEEVRSGDFVEILFQGKICTYLIQVTNPYDRIHGTELYRDRSR